LPSINKDETFFAMEVFRFPTQQESRIVTRFDRQTKSSKPSLQMQKSHHSNKPDYSSGFFEVTQILGQDVQIPVGFFRLFLRGLC